MLANVVVQVVQLYIYLIIANVLLSWFPVSGVFADIQRAIASIVEPYLGLFRRIIPPLGMIDISPIVAIVVLNIATSLLVRFL